MILSIDCGSTNHKVALFDEGLRRMAESAAPVSHAVRDAERVEFELGKIWAETVSLIRRVCEQARIGPGRIRTIALASQAQTFTLLDGAGEPVIPFLSWADKRAQAEASELAEKVGAQFHRHCSFPAPLPQLQISKLLWWARRVSRAQRAGVRVVPLPAYLAWRLAGVRGTDPNLASMSGLYSLVSGEWWDDALRACNLDRAQCGPLVPTGRPMAAQARCAELDFSPELDILFAGNDQTAGAFGNVAGMGSLVLALGTALVAYRVAGRAAGPFHRAGCWGPYPGGGFYELLTRDEGCAALDWACAQLTGGDRTAFFSLAGAVSFSRARFFPQRMRTAGAWEGSSAIEDRARAVIEGLCFSLREMVEALLPAADRREVIAVGGGSASRLWLSLLANVLNRSVRRGSGDILLGAARMVRPGIELVETGSESFEPEPGAAGDYSERYQAWQQHQKYEPERAALY